MSSRAFRRVTSFGQFRVVRGRCMDNVLFCLFWLLGSDSSELFSQTRSRKWQMRAWRCAVCPFHSNLNSLVWIPLLGCAPCSKVLSRRWNSGGTYALSLPIVHAWLLRESGRLYTFGHWTPSTISWGVGYRREWVCWWHSSRRWWYRAHLPELAQSSESFTKQVAYHTALLHPIASLCSMTAIHVLGPIHLVLTLGKLRPLTLLVDWEKTCAHSSVLEGCYVSDVWIVCIPPVQTKPYSLATSIMSRAPIFTLLWAAQASFRYWWKLSRKQIKFMRGLMDLTQIQRVATFGNRTKPSHARDLLFQFQFRPWNGETIHPCASKEDFTATRGVFRYFCFTNENRMVISSAMEG